jgi:hypothetical protein
MLNQGHFYHQTVRRAIIAFGTVFNNIQIRRRDSNGNVVQSLKVPLAYGPRQKFLSRLYDNPDPETNPIQLTLPRMGFEMTNLLYDSQRKANTLQQKKISGSDGNTALYQYSSVPYTMDLSLSIFAKNQDDALQVVEQIIPFFTPALNLSVKAVPEMGIVDDFPVILTDVSFEDDYEGDFASRRSIIYTMNFQIKLNFYGPIHERGMIKKVNVNSYLDTDTTFIDSKYEVSVDPLDASPEDAYGFDEVVTEQPSLDS